MMRPNMQNFSGIRRDKVTGEEYVVHLPSGVIYLLRKPTADVAAVRAQTVAPVKAKKVMRPVYPKLARATFIEGSEPDESTV